MKVSVIIPNYNHAAFLKLRIESVLNQSFPDFEVIILDDCSTDNSREVIEQYRNHPKVSHIVFNKTNSGTTFKQWEKGIELAKGEWIWIAESDDWCEPTLLNELVSNSITDPDVVMAYCQSVFISKEDKIFGKTLADFLCETVDGQQFVKKRMLGLNTIVNASMAVFRKSVWSQIPKDFVKMKYCGDWLFWVNVCLQGKVFISGKYLNYYLRHENNVGSSAIRMGYDFLEGNLVYHYIINKIPVSLEDKKKALFIRANMYSNIKENLLNQDIKNQVLKSMLSLDPNMATIIKRTEQSFKRLKVFNSIKYYLKLLVAKN